MTNQFETLALQYPNVTIDEIEILAEIVKDEGKPETLAEVVKDFSEYVAYIILNGFENDLIGDFAGWQANKHLLQ